MSRQSKQVGKQLTREAEGGPRDRHLARIKSKQAEHNGMSVRLSRRGKRILKLAAK